MFNLFTFEKTIGIVGIGGAGKTVFLTALLAQLRNHDPDRFLLESEQKNATIIKFKEIKDDQLGIPQFNQEQSYNYFVNDRKWPDKTEDSSYYRCQFERTDWRRSLDLTFIDFPGERFNDMLMMGEEADYAYWSDVVLKRIQDNPVCAQMAEDYFNLLEQDSLDMEAILREYKILLGRLIRDYGAFITPSVFALDLQGQAFRSRDQAEDRLAGCEHSSQFAPLPAHIRQQQTSIWEKFSAHYQKYKRQVVQPQFDNLRRCHILLVLVDVTSLLSGHVGRFNDTENIIGDVIAAVAEKKESSHFFDRLFNLFRFDRIEKIGFVATKSDMIYPDDADTLQSLIKELAWQRTKNHPELKHAFFSCSAIKSTRLDQQGRLLGYPIWNNQGKRNPPPKPNDPLQILDTSRLPKNWPDYWEMGDYYFPAVWPILPQRKTLTPEHDGLNHIFNFILE